MTVFGRMRDEVARRRLAAETSRSLTAPRPGAFAHFGEGSVVVPPTRFHNPRFMEIGDAVSILELGFLSAQPGADGTAPRLVVGDGSRLSQMVTVACVGSVVIGSHVLIAAGSFIGDASHAYDDAEQPILHQGMGPSRPVTIGDGAFVGIRSVVLPGASIGQGAFIGAGSVVSGEVPARTVAAGNPARVIRQHVEGEGWVRV